MRRRWKTILVVLSAMFIAGIPVGCLDPEVLEDDRPRPVTTTTTAAVVENDCNRKIGRAKTLAESWLAEAEAALEGDTLAYDVATLTYSQMQGANLDAFECTLNDERYEEAEAWADLSMAGQGLHDDLLVICAEEFEPLGHEC